jgi:glycosyltransferase involved in cell wall biosynthesis
VKYQATKDNRIGAKLDIITVTRDDFPGLRSTIESTRKLRDLRGIKQIIIDSSTSPCREKVKNLAETEPHVVYRWQEPGGISRAFNLGLETADAEWVWFLNGKDEVHDRLDANVFWGVISSSSADMIVFEIELMPSGQKCGHPPVWARWPATGAWLPHPATISRKSFYKKHGMFNERFRIAMDYEYWLRCSLEDLVIDSLSFPVVKFDMQGISYNERQLVAAEAMEVLRMHAWKLLKLWFRTGRMVTKAWLRFSKMSKR